MQAINISTLSKKIISFFSKRVSSLGRETKFSQRESKLNTRAFVETLLMSCLNEKTHYEAQCSLLQQKNIRITKQGLACRMNDKAVRMMGFLLDESLTTFKSESGKTFDLLKPFTSVKIQDSSGIELPSNMRSFFKGHGGDASSASLKMQVLYDDLNSSIDKLYVTDGTHNDQGFTAHLDSIHESALYIQDLGYFSLQSFKRIMDGKGYFLSRYLPQTHLYSMDGTEIDLLKLLRETSTTYYQTQILVGKNQRLPVRLVIQRLEDAQKNQRLKNIRKSYKKKHPSQLILELAGWSIYITNIPESLISEKALHALYVSRWQIELFFKLIKSHAQLDAIRGKNRGRILCELYAKLIVIILFLHIASPCRWLNGRELSLNKAYQLFQFLAFPLFHALRSIYRLKQLLSSLLLQFASCALKDKQTPKKSSSYQKIQDLGKQENSF